MSRVQVTLVNVAKLASSLRENVHAASISCAALLKVTVLVQARSVSTVQLQRAEHECPAAFTKQVCFLLVPRQAVRVEVARVCLRLRAEYHSHTLVALVHIPTHCVVVRSKRRWLCRHGVITNPTLDSQADELTTNTGRSSGWSPSSSVPL